MRNPRPHITTTYEWMRSLAAHAYTLAVTTRRGAPVIHWRF